MYGIPVPESQLPESIDWDAVIKLARKHVVYGIIVESVGLLPERLRPSAKISAEMKRFALGLIRTSLAMDRTIGLLVAFLQYHDIHGVLLKGAGVARYYKKPQMRHTGDIDFYVGKEQYSKAVDICRERLTDEKAECHEDEQHFGFDWNGAYVELHRRASKMFSPKLNKLFQQWTIKQLEGSAARRSMRIENVDVSLPSYDFDAIYIFYHAWRHYIQGGIGLRQLCDWAMIFHAHASDIDTNQLIQNIRRFGLTNAWKLFACIAVNHLGLSKDKMPLYDPTFHKKSEKALAKIMAGGNFGFYTEAYRRTRQKSFGLSYGIFKLINKTRNFVSLFSTIPTEATYFYIHNIFQGTISVIERSIKQPKKRQH